MDALLGGAVGVVVVSLALAANALRDLARQAERIANALEREPR